MSRNPRHSSAQTTYGKIKINRSLSHSPARLDFFQATAWSAGPIRMRVHRIVQILTGLLVIRRKWPNWQRLFDFSTQQSWLFQLCCLLVPAVVLSYCKETTWTQKAAGQYALKNFSVWGDTAKGVAKHGKNHKLLSLRRWAEKTNGWFFLNIKTARLNVRTFSGTICITRTTTSTLENEICAVQEGRRTRKLPVLDAVKLPVAPSVLSDLDLEEIASQAEASQLSVDLCHRNSTNLSGIRSSHVVRTFLPRSSLPHHSNFVHWMKK